jgi:hypothetical protein
MAVKSSFWTMLATYLTPCAPFAFHFWVSSPPHSTRGKMLFTEVSERTRLRFACGKLKRIFPRLRQGRGFAPKLVFALGGYRPWAGLNSFGSPLRRWKKSLGLLIYGFGLNDLARPLSTMVGTNHFVCLGKPIADVQLLSLASVFLATLRLRSFADIK